MYPQFIWERLGETLHIRSDRRYLVYYKGCFCPPHIGHFDTAASYLRSNNVKMIIHQMGNQRHNIPTDLNRSIWKTYIRELLPTNNVDLVQYNDNSKDVLYNHPWLDKANILIIIRGDEADNIKSQERRNLRNWKHIINNCKSRGIEIIFHYTLRDTEKISATTFIDKVIKYKNRRLHKEDLYKYMPDKLSIESKDKIIRRVARYYLL
jgi:hypothetical protein